MAITDSPSLSRWAPLSSKYLDRRRLATICGSLVFVFVVGGLVIYPLVELQLQAFKGHGANTYSGAFRQPGFASTIKATVWLAVGSLAIAMVLGTALALAASRLPRRLQVLSVLPILPIVIPAIAAISGWAFMLAPGPGYVNAVLRLLPW